MSADARVPITLTPNAALAQELRHRQLTASGHRSQPRAAIQVFQDWLGKSIRSELPLASDIQLRALWEIVITEEAGRSDSLNQFNPAKLAPTALNAWRNLKRWRVPATQLSTAETGQLIGFRHWANRFERILARHGVTTLELEVARHLEEPATSRQPEVRLYAFIDTPPPLWHDWLAHNFATLHLETYQVRPEPEGHVHASNPRLFRAETPDLELMAAVQWAATVLKADASARVAIVDTELRHHVKALQRLAEAILPNTPVWCAAQPPLLDQGPVITALALLRLNLRQLDLADARLIAQSPLWGDFAGEHAARASWDQALCAARTAELFSADVIGLAATHKETEPLAERLRGAFSGRRQHSLSPLAWADLFMHQLGSLGWLGVESGDIGQKSQGSWTTTPGAPAWIEALEAFASLGLVKPSLDAPEALACLEHCLSQSQSTVSVPPTGVVFLDTIEATVGYTQAWILGMDQQRWPGSPEPNPLLPAGLQARYGMPRATAAMQAELAGKLLDRACGATPELICSYSIQDGDIACSPWSALENFPELPLDAISTPLHPTADTQTRLEWVQCTQAPGVPQQHAQVKKGASLLRTMARSPFDAFAHWRLHAEPLDEPGVGFSALDRGNLVHEVLNQVWLTLGDSRKLSRLTSEDVGALCAEICAREIRHFQVHHGWQKKGFADLEIRRVADLVSEWLEFERTRPEFTLELAEKALDARIGGLSFGLRLDRLDRLASGETVLIDYKTGASLKRSTWLDMPPEEPQLPLYALMLDQMPDAICFARVRAGEMAFIGVGQTECLDGVWPQEKWQELAERWRHSLEELAGAYLRGDTRIFGTMVLPGTDDPLAPLHRWAEFDSLEEHRHRFVPARRSQ